MNDAKRIKLSLLIVMLVSSALISALVPAQASDEARTPQAGQMKMAPPAGLAVNPDGGKVVNEAPDSLLELVEFYSRKYFKFAFDYLFDFLNSLGIFAPDDLAVNLNSVDRSAAQFT